MSKKTMVVSVVTALVALVAQADLVLDQQQTTVTLGTLGEGWLVGLAGESDYQLAQTVTAGIGGRLSRVELPIECEGGTLIVEITDVVDGDEPGTTVLSRTEVDGSLFPPDTGFPFRAIDLAAAPRISAGVRFAIVLSNPTGRCGVGMGTLLDLYPRGRSVFRFRPDAFWQTTGGFSDPIDSAFRTWVETGSGAPGGGSSGLCTIHGFPGLPVPVSSPVCRCLRDPGLREFRCGLFHPSMFLFRRIPEPIRAGEPFPVKWTLVALAPLKGTVELTDVFPAGFNGPKSPLTFFVDQLPVGGSVTLEYKATAPKGGKYKVDTILDDGRMQTMIEVVPK
jgi:hypothetical protein